MERKSRSCTYQRKTERGEDKGKRERGRDGTQHWLPNYAFYHFSHNRVPSFFSCPVYASCSCSSAALMRKMKNNHKHVIFTSTRPPHYVLLRHHIHTNHLPIMRRPHSHSPLIFLFIFFFCDIIEQCVKTLQLSFFLSVVKERWKLASMSLMARYNAMANCVHSVVSSVLTLWLVQIAPFSLPYWLSPHVPGSQS